jgi:flavin reductase (DIM6/NTAB) family NADH-FMN oxidoreductase RutF
MRFRSTVGCFPTGVAALCAWVDGANAGLTVASFTSVSLDPPLVSVCVRDTSATWRVLRRAGRVGISVLAGDQATACRQLAGEPAGRFHDLPTVRSAAGAVFVSGAVAWLECAVRQEILAGDHWLILLGVCGMSAEPETPPLVVHRSRVRPLPGGP